MRCRCVSGSLANHHLSCITINGYIKTLLCILQTVLFKKEKKGLKICANLLSLAQKKTRSKYLPKEMVVLLPLLATGVARINTKWVSCSCFKWIYIFLILFHRHMPGAINVTHALSAELTCFLIPTYFPCSDDSVLSYIYCWTEPTHNYTYFIFLLSKDIMYDTLLLHRPSWKCRTSGLHIGSSYCAWLRAGTRVFISFSFCENLL